MPSRNIIRFDVPDAYYHVYVRGVNKSTVFLEPEDKDYLLYLFGRYLSKRQVITKTGYVYPMYANKLEMLSFCIMDNHLHLLLYEVEQGGISSFMQSLLSAYTVYYNKKYKRCGPLFESRFKSSNIDHETYLLHISRYIHLNPRHWKLYKYSSITYFRDGNEPEWLNTKKVLAQHESREAYLVFVADYQANKEMLSEIKYELAGL